MLPAIRKDEAYILGEDKVRTGEMTEAELALQAVAALNAKVARLTAERGQLAAGKAATEARAAAAEIKAAALDHLASSEGLLTSTEAANALGMRSAIALNRMMESAKALRRVRGVVVPTAAYASKGYFRVISREVNGHVREQTMWTTQGIAWAAQRLTKVWAAA